MKHLFSMALFAGLFTLATSCNNETDKTTEAKQEIKVVAPEDHTKAIKEIVDTYQAAYNKEDVEGIRNLFTANAERIETDGKVINGRDAIAKLYADAFAGSDTQLTITQQTAESQDDGNIHSTGTWQVTGKTSTGETIERKGTYEVIDVQENGQWKIKKQVVKEG